MHRTQNAMLTFTAPFLPVRTDFHPKRNQARQKLATLPKNRFKDLASDVFFELRRRYPEFEEEVSKQQQQSQPQPQPQDGGYEELASYDTVGALPQREGSNGGGGMRPTHNRQQSSMGRSMASSGDRMEIMSNGHDRQGALASLTAATNDVVVPNKSRLQEEEIEVPYARDSTMDPDTRPIVGGPGPSGLRDVRSDSRTSERDRGQAPSREDTVTSPGGTDDQYYDRVSLASTTRSKIGGGGGGSAWDDRETKMRNDYEFKFANLERRAQQIEKERDDAVNKLAEAEELLKDYKDEVRGHKERSTTHASSLRSLQHELDLAQDATAVARKQAEQTTQQTHQEIREWRERCEGLEDELRRVEEEKNDRATQSTSSIDPSMLAEFRAEMDNLGQEIHALEAHNEHLKQQQARSDEALARMEAKVDEYKKLYKAARTELRNIKATSTMFVTQPLSNDHFPATPDGNIDDTHVMAFQQAVDGLLQVARSSTPSGVLSAMKAIVEAATAIGEDVKSFEEAPNLDVDASRLESLKHESTTCLSKLMNAARNHAMSSGLSPVSLIDAATGHLSDNIVQLIKLLGKRRSSQNRDILNSTRMSIGDMVRRGTGFPDDDDKNAPQSPTTNLAAHHPGTGYEHRINSFQSATSTAQRSDSFALEQTLDRKTSSTSMATSDYDGPRPGRDLPGRDPRADPYARSAGPAGPLKKVQEQNSRSPGHSFTSLSSTSSPSQSGYGYSTERFQSLTQGSPKGSAKMPNGSSSRGGAASLSNSGGSTSAANGLSGSTGSDKEWDDLKSYLNTQSTALVNAIQNLLAAIRTGGQGPDLNDHLTEVIAISTSIVASSRNALAPRLRPDGDPLLDELTANTDSLSAAQESAARTGGFDKELRKEIAKSSFNVAKALKALMKLDENGA
jgi:hypothetical protein